MTISYRVAECVRNEWLTTAITLDAANLRHELSLPQLDCRLLHTLDVPYTGNHILIFLSGAVLYYHYVRLLNFRYNILNYNNVLRQCSSGVPDRLHDLRVGLRTTWPAEGKTNLISFNKQCAVLRGKQPQRRVDITCDDGATGSYLVIQIEGKRSVLTMCEVEVYEHVDGK